MLPVATVAALVVTGTACGSKPSTAATPCSLAAEDSVFATPTRAVYRDCAVDRRAKLTSTNVHPDLSGLSTMRGTQCYSAEVKFVVGPKGNPESETVKIVRASNGEFGDAWARVVPRLRYDPAMKDGVPVRQIVVEHFVTGTTTVVVRKGDPLPPNVAGNAARPNC